MIIEEIKSRVSIADILADAGIHLTRCRGRCPIHGGKNSFSFSVRGDRWKCFSCGEQGDLIDLDRALNSGSTGEAIRRLADRAGISRGPLSPTERRAMNRARQERDRRKELKAKYKAWVFDHETETATCLRMLRRAKARWTDFTQRGLEKLAAVQVEIDYAEYLYNSVFCGRDEGARLELYKGAVENEYSRT